MRLFAGYTDEPPTYGTVMTVEQFREDVEDGMLIDYDGFGHPMRDGLVDTSVDIYPSEVEEPVSVLCNI